MPRLLPSPLLMIYTLHSCYTCHGFRPTLRKLFHLRGSEAPTPGCGLAKCLIRNEPQRPRRAAPASRQTTGHTPQRSASAGAEPPTRGTPPSPDTPGGPAPRLRVFRIRASVSAVTVGNALPATKHQVPEPRRHRNPPSRSRGDPERRWGGSIGTRHANGGEARANGGQHRAVGAASSQRTEDGRLGGLLRSELSPHLPSLDKGVQNPAAPPPPFLAQVMSSFRKLRSKLNHCVDDCKHAHFLVPGLCGPTGSKRNPASATSLALAFPVSKAGLWALLYISGARGARNIISCSVISPPLLCCKSQMKAGTADSTRLSLKHLGSW